MEHLSLASRHVPRVATHGTGLGCSVSRRRWRRNWPVCSRVSMTSMAPLSSSPASPSQGDPVVLALPLGEVPPRVPGRQGAFSSLGGGGRGDQGSSCRGKRGTGRRGEPRCLLSHLARRQARRPIGGRSSCRRERSQHARQSRHGCQRQWCRGRRGGGGGGGGGRGPEHGALLTTMVWQSDRIPRRLKDI